MYEHKVPIFVINLPHRIDRWKSSLEQLDKIEPVIEKIYKIKATDSNSAKQQMCTYITKTAYQNIQNKKFTHILPTWGSLGCAISHINTWKYIVENNIKYALICEDDIQINDSGLCFDIIESIYLLINK